MDRVDRAKAPSPMPGEHVEARQELESFIGDHRGQGSWTANLTPLASNGYLLTGACPCGVVFER